VIRTAYLDADGYLLFPAVTTALLALVAGVLAGAGWSPLGWAELIVARGIR
jgi:multicomponent Na+:H+ antiporter subunit D